MQLLSGKQTALESLLMGYGTILFLTRFNQMQPVYSPSVLAEMIRPDGSSTISVFGGESLPAELAHELMSIQVCPFIQL